MDETTRHAPDGIDGDAIDIVEGPVGSASLKEPSEVARSAADRDALPSIEEDHAAGSADDRA